LPKVPLWRSDNPGDGDAVIGQTHTMGLTNFAPLSAGGVAGWDPYVYSGQLKSFAIFVGLKKAR
jgi:hypothetical protein